MAKKQTSFADKAAKHRGKGGEAVYAKYVKSVRSEKTGHYCRPDLTRFCQNRIHARVGLANDDHRRRKCQLSHRRY